MIFTQNYNVAAEVEHDNFTTGPWPKAVSRWIGMLRIAYGAVGLTQNSGALLTWKVCLFWGDCLTAHQQQGH